MTPSQKLFWCFQIDIPKYFHPQFEPLYRIGALKRVSDQLLPTIYGKITNPTWEEREIFDIRRLNVQELPSLVIDKIENFSITPTFLTVRQEHLLGEFRKLENPSKYEFFLFFKNIQNSTDAKSIFVNRNKFPFDLGMFVRYCRGFDTEIIQLLLTFGLSNVDCQSLLRNLVSDAKFSEISFLLNHEPYGRNLKIEDRMILLKYPNQYHFGNYFVFWSFDQRMEYLKMMRPGNLPLNGLHNILIEISKDHQVKLFKKLFSLNNATTEFFTSTRMDQKFFDFNVIKDNENLCLLFCGIFPTKFFQLYLKFSPNARATVDIVSFINAANINLIHSNNLVIPQEIIQQIISNKPYLIAYLQIMKGGWEEELNSFLLYCDSKYLLTIIVQLQKISILPLETYLLAIERCEDDDLIELFSIINCNGDLLNAILPNVLNRNINKQTLFQTYNWQKLNYHPTSTLK